MLNELLITEICARAAHEANRAYCQAIGDNTQLPWDEAADWQRDSARKGVAGALAGNTPKQQHRAWFEDKWSQGWHHGWVKDAEKKTHPCMVPYEELPPEQQLKYALYVSVVQATATALKPQAPLKYDELLAELKAGRLHRPQAYGLLIEAAIRENRQITLKVESQVEVFPTS